MASPATATAKAPANGGNNAVPTLPFTRAAKEHTEPAFDKSVTLTTSTQDFGVFDVPAYGYFRHLLLLVQATGAADTTGDNAALAADGPWNTIEEIAVLDVNGAPIFGPVSGYTAFLIHKWGAYNYDQDPTTAPVYDVSDADGTGDGNFSFLLRIPIEIVGRDALGALPNQNAAATYKVRITLAASGTIYSTQPDATLPSVRIRGFLEAWTQPNPQAPNGQPQATRPPHVGTTQFWSRYLANVNSGANTIRFPRVGNLIRNLLLVYRTDAGARNSSNLPDPIRMYIDGRTMFNEALAVRDNYARERNGFDPDTGLMVYGFTHDFDYKSGGEMKDLWLVTVQSTRLEIEGSFGAAGTLEVITNDVVPAGGA